MMYLMVCNQVMRATKQSAHQPKSTLGHIQTHRQSLQVQVESDLGFLLSRLSVGRNRVSSQGSTAEQAIQSYVQNKPSCVGATTHADSIRFHKLPAPESNVSKTTSSICMVPMQKAG